MIAHRKGFVVLTFLKKNDSLGKILFRVDSYQERKLKKEHKKWFCRIQGVKCILNSNIVRGVISSWQDFYLIKNWCLQRNSFSFQVKLSKSAQRALKEKLKKSLNGLASFVIGSEGLIFLKHLVREKITKF